MRRLNQPIRMAVTLSIDPNIWRSFRQACQEESVIPSRLVEDFMREWLAAWQQETQKDTNHV